MVTEPVTRRHSLRCPSELARKTNGEARLPGEPRVRPTGNGNRWCGSDSRPTCAVEPAGARFGSHSALMIHHIPTGRADGSRGAWAWRGKAACLHERRAAFVRVEREIGPDGADGSPLLAVARPLNGL